MSQPKGRPPASDCPPEDLKKERDAFIQQFFRKGAQLTEELLKESERLHERISALETENSQLRTHLAGDQAIRDLFQKIEALEAEKQELLNRSRKAEAEESGVTALYSEVENELANFANLYVASSQLLGARSVRSVLRNLKELLAQLVGAAAFVVYMVDEPKDELVAIGSEGVRADDLSRVRAGEGPIGGAFRANRIDYETEGDPTKGTLAAPVAVVPLTLEGRAVGAIVVVSTLPQKTEFVNVDIELFRLLGAQAAAALVNARLFVDAGRKLPGVEAFLDLED